MKKFKVTCKKCKMSDQLAIDEKNNVFWSQVKYIVSSRYRLDMQWGWQCLCGNNDLVSKQERNGIKNLQAPDPKDISKVLKSIEFEKPKFKMEEI